MAELTIRPEEIRDALENFVQSYKPDAASREEVGTVSEAGDEHGFEPQLARGPEEVDAAQEPEEKRRIAEGRMDTLFAPVYDDHWGGYINPTHRRMVGHFLALCPPRARILGSTVAAIRPEIMGLGPIPAIQALLKETGMTIDDIDVVEINEAFAAQIVPCKDELGIDDDKLNPFGGAIALGHPFGMTGARIMTTLLNDLETLDKTYGIESMCVAGGMGMAMLVERMN